MPETATDTSPATAGGRPDSPPAPRQAPQSSAKPMPSSGQIQSSNRRTDAKAQMRAVGEAMKNGTPVPQVATQAPASQPGNAPVTAPATTKPQAAVETPEQKVAKADKLTKLLQAKRVLVRDGWQPTDFAKFAEDDLIARADKRSKSHAEMDRLVGEHSQLKKQLPAQRAPDGTFTEKTVTPGTQPAAQPQGQAGQLNADPDVAALLQKAEAKMGPEAAKFMGEFAELLQSKASGQNNAAAATVYRSMVMKEATDTFAREYADQDPAAMAEFLPMFGSLLTTGNYVEGQESKAISDTLLLMFGAPNPVRQAQRDMLARQTAAQTGKVDPGQQRTEPANAQPTTKRDQLKRIGELMKANPNASQDQLRQLMAAG